ncbi:hypothetical protein [Streptomyces sparsogenes]|uniref:Putative alanine-rich protein n=1 Tax=Streptomyces sparsogenes DSM 40356 TaxID=1331668 RepID=A0A1R1SGV3_9ACTN|nr:hypothetical protein [Streptomyces sparsogenes]OMI37473.1 putative alanine-rich protein [Streptomyces sparsogenes DSM 40356]
MKASAFVYPWDVVGDPDAARRIADLGVQQVTLASAYHSTRALTPRHPRHRVVTARHAAVLYPPDPERWADRPLRPYRQSWVEGADPYGEAARALADAGLEVHSWVVLAHNSRLGDEHPRTSVRNAYGDHYPWAPCVARPEVRSYVVDLAAEAAVRPGTLGTELESCGWYGVAHLHAHDKIGGVPLGGAAQYLMSLCFCDSCHAGYASLGADPEELRRAVLRALRPVWAGEAGQGGGDRAAEWAEVEKLLGGDHAATFAAWRDRVAAELQRDAVAAVREAAGGPFQVLLHADPAPHRLGANAGVDPAGILRHADGVVLPCTGSDAARTDVLTPFAPHRTERTTLAANFTVVAGMGGSPATLEADATHAAGLGADEIRLYHAGLASDADLAAVRTALERLP